MSQTTVNKWVVLAFAAGMQAVVMGTAIYAFAFYVVPWMEEFQVDRGTLMVPMMLLSIMGGVMSPVGGYLLDRYSSRDLVLIGAFAFSLGLLGVSIAQGTLTITLLFTLVLPIGIALSGPLMANSLAARSFDENRGLALGLVALGASVGGLVMPVVVTTLLDQFAWRSVFQILALIVMLTVFLPGLFVLKKGAGEHVGKQSAGSTQDSLKLMGSRSVLQLGIVFLAPVLIYSAILHNTGALAVDLAISQQNAAYVIAVSSIVMAVGKVLAGVLSDRINHYFLYTFIVAVMTIGVVIISGASSYSALMIGVCLMTFAFGGVVPLVASMVAVRWGVDNFGRVMGMVYAWTALSGIGPVVAGFIRDYSGSYSLAFMSLLAILVPALVCFFTLPKQASEKELPLGAG